MALARLLYVSLPPKLFQSQKLQLIPLIRTDQALRPPRFSTTISFSPKLFQSKPQFISFRRTDQALRPRFCSYSSGNRPDPKGSRPKWQIFRRWSVPWNWQTIYVSSLACGFSFVLTGRIIEKAAITYTAIQLEELSLDEKAEIMFLGQAIASGVVLGVLYTLTKSSKPLPNDIYRYDWREPFNLQRGWLLWAGIGVVGSVAAIALTAVAIDSLNIELPRRETDTLVHLLPFIGYSTISTLSLLGIVGVLAPVLEETVFRGFFMVSLTKWLPTPLAVLLSSAVFAGAHLTPAVFPQIFALGTVFGFSYAQTRNLLTPITIHAFWNSGSILLFTFLKLQGYDINELIQASRAKKTDQIS